MTSDYRILTGEIRVDRLREEGVYEIIRYGWDSEDLKRMLQSRDYQAIAFLAIWTRDCGDEDPGWPSRRWPKCRTGRSRSWTAGTSQSTRTSTLDTDS